MKNAIKYTDEGFVEFGYVKDGAYLKFYVRDSGIGIPKERHSAIFERFIQADIADIQVRQGAGLGLSIAKASVEMPGGKIWLESEVGEGSVFYFTIPYQAKPQIRSTWDNIAADKEQGIKPLKTLIVEDDETSQIYISLILENLSKEIITVGNGKEAIKICQNNTDIDLIMMDIRMPIMNEYKATQEIRKFNKDVVIIAQTAFALSGDQEKAIKSGCDDYLPKPIDKPELLKLIKKYF
ncbi:MAG: response regulator [Bacteroidales bacterium]|jgi:CheY-like chemotaxis protein